MGGMWGADIAALEGLGRGFHTKADQLEHTAQQLTFQSSQAGWEGSDALRFQQVWSGEHRPRLLAIATDLRATGDRLIQQAHDQERASGAGGAGGFAGGGGGGGGGGGWGPGGGPDFADRVRSANDFLTPARRAFSVADRLTGIPGVGGASHVFSGFNYFTDGVTIGDDLANGHYVDAGLHTILTGGDLTADGLKQTHTLQGYLGGVAVQAWTQAGRAAMDVDWSAQGMQQIGDASLGDWGVAFGDAAKQMPGQLVDIFF